MPVGTSWKYSALGLVPILAALFFTLAVINRPFRHVDEYLTAERVREIPLTGSYLTSYENFAPSFHKPPLYYVTSSIWARFFPHQYWTIRVLSLGYGLGCLVLCFLVMRALVPGSPWAPPLAALIPLASYVFVFSLCSAQLDTGMAFYMLLACYSFTAITAWIKNGCLFCALALGTLHKLPLGFLVLFLALLLDTLFPEGSPLAGKKQFRLAWIALLIPLAWIVYLAIRHGSDFIRMFFVNEMWNRTTNPEFSSINAGVDYFKDLGLRWWYLGIPACLSAAAHLVLPSWRKNKPGLLIALIFILSTLFLFCMPYRSSRYLVFLIPFGSILICYGLARLSENRSWIPLCLYALLLCAMGCTFKTVYYSKLWQKFRDSDALIEAFKKDLLPSETPVVITITSISAAQVLFETGLERPLASGETVLYLAPETKLRCLIAPQVLEAFTPYVDHIQIEGSCAAIIYLTAQRNEKQAASQNP